MQQITSSDFIKSIIKGGIPVIIEDKEITNRVAVQSNLIATGVIIRNCIFHERVLFEKLDFNCGIKFIDCEFNKSLSINNCKANKYDQLFNFSGYHLEFKNTQINNLYFNGKNEIERGVKISKKSRINRLIVNTLHSKIGNFTINDSTIESQFDIFQGIFSNDVEVRNNSVIETKVRFENVSTGSIVFTDSTFEKNIHISAGKVGSLIFNDGFFKDDLNITGVPISSSMTIIGTEFKKSINFKLQDDPNKKAGSLKHIYISSAKFDEQFIVNGNDALICDLTIDFSQQLVGALYFNSCNFLKTKLSRCNYHGNVVFNHCNFNNLSFDFFDNYSTFSIISAKALGENSEITIHHSNLGKTQFFNTFFNTFENINIYNSVLIDIITANVKWFSDKNLNSKTIETSPDYTQKKEIYRQIKFALERQGDRISSLKFKALEMNAYKKELFAQVKWYKRIFNGNRFVLWVGKTNDFGQNWIKPILFAIGFGILFHLLIVIGISDKLSYFPNLEKESFSITWNEYYNNLNALPQLMNPAHILKRIFPNTINIGFTVYCLDYLLKIITAFFIFQVISAFRKYMK